MSRADVAGWWESSGEVGGQHMSECAKCGAATSGAFCASCGTPTGSETAVEETPPGALTPPAASAPVSATGAVLLDVLLQPIPIHAAQTTRHAIRFILLL